MVSGVVNLEIQQMSKDFGKGSPLLGIPFMHGLSFVSETDKFLKR